MISEEDFHRNIVQLAQTTHWRIHHDRGDYRQCIAGDPGFPDLVLARDGRVIFAELKSETGVLSASQVGWLGALIGEPWIGAPNFQRDIEVYVWRPADIERIAKILSPRRR
jgi:hypothetical protein